MQLNYQAHLDLPNSKQTSAKIMACFVLSGFFHGLLAIAIAVLRSNSGGLHGVLSLFVFSAIPVAVMALILFPVYLCEQGEANRIDLLRAAFSMKQYLVRWEYSAENWAMFRKSQERSENRCWNAIVWVLGGFAGFFLLLGIFLPMLDHSHGDSNPFVLLAVFGSFSIVLLIILMIYVQMAKKWQLMLETPQPTIIGTMGAYANGHWILWGTAFRKLVRVEVRLPQDPAPLTLELAQTNGSNVTSEHVLVPAADRDLAFQVANRIKAAPTAEQGGRAANAMLIVRLIARILRFFV